MPIYRGKTKLVEEVFESVMVGGYLTRSNLLYYWIGLNKIKGRPILKGSPFHPNLGDQRFGVAGSTVANPSGGLGFSVFGKRNFNQMTGNINIIEASGT